MTAIVFDLDGLLIDSEPHWQRAEQDAFHEIGFHLSNEHCSETTGLRIDEAVEHYCKKFRLSRHDKAVLENEIVARVIALVREHGTALPGAIELVESARSQASKVGIASSSPKAVISAALETLQIHTLFDCICSAEDESYGKPHPAVYLTAANRLEVPATQCVAVEDSLNGVIAAKSARMRCVTVLSDDPHSRSAAAISDIALNSLSEWTAETWDKIQRLSGDARKF